MKKILIYTDQHKFDVIIAERKRFAKELNQGLELLKELPFVEPDQVPALEDLRMPQTWWDARILEAIQPKKVKGWEHPRQQALGYSCEYDRHVKEINSVPWSAMEMLDFVDGEFVVTPGIEEKVRKESSTYGTPEQAEVFEKLETMLEMLNRYCDHFISLKADLSAIADALQCRVIQNDDKSHRIVPDYRRLMLIMRKGTSNY